MLQQHDVVAAQPASIWQPRLLAFALASGTGIAGMWGQRLVVGWMLWQVTQSGAWLTALGAAELLPILALGVLIGGLIDTADIRLVLQFGQWGAAAAGGALLWAVSNVHNEAWLLIAITAVAAVFGMSVLTARVAATGLLVAPGALPRATGLVNMTGHLGLALGPLLVGTQLSGGRVVAAVAVSTVLLAVSAALFGLLPAAQRPKAAGSIGFRQSLLDGLRHVANEPVVRVALLTFLLSVLVGRGMHDVLPAYVAATLDGGATLVSQMIALGGCGSLGVSVYLMAGGSVDQRVQLVSGLLLLVVALLALTLGQSWQALAAGGLLGAGLSLTSSAAQCLVLAHTAPFLVGRVMSIYTLIWRGAPPLGVIALGLIADRWAITSLPLILTVVTMTAAPLIGYGLHVSRRTDATGARTS